MGKFSCGGREIELIYKISCTRQYRKNKLFVLEGWSGEGGSEGGTDGGEGRQIINLEDRGRVEGMSKATKSQLTQLRTTARI